MEEVNDRGEDFSIGYEMATTPSGVYEIVCLRFVSVGDDLGKEISRHRPRSAEVSGNLLEVIAMGYVCVIVMGPGALTECPPDVGTRGVILRVNRDLRVEEMH